MRRPGIWVANGNPGDTQQLYSWQPGAIGSFVDFLTENDVYNYKATHPETPVVVRFQHPQKLVTAAIHKGTRGNLGQYIAGKWPEIQPLEPIRLLCQPPQHALRKW
jgi:hypothetical protein